MAWRTFIGLCAALAALVVVGWHYLPQWPKWLSTLWGLTVFGLGGYGFYKKVQDFFGAERTAGHEDH